MIRVARGRQALRNDPKEKARQRPLALAGLFAYLEHLIKMAKNHTFDPDLAAEFGLGEAILIQSFAWWLEHIHAEGQNASRGHTWIETTYRGTARLFPYYSPTQVRRIIDSLVESGVLLREQRQMKRGDSTNWYAFRDEKRFLGRVTPVDFDSPLSVRPLSKSTAPELPKSTAPCARPYSDSVNELDSSLDPSGLGAAAPGDSFEIPPPPPGPKGKASQDQPVKPVKPEPDQNSKGKAKAEDPAYVEARAGVREVFLRVRGYELTFQTEQAKVKENSGVKSLAQMVVAMTVTLSQIEAYLRHQQELPYWQDKEIPAVLVAQNLQKWLQTPEGKMTFRAIGQIPPTPVRRKEPEWDEAAWEREQAAFAAECARKKQRAAEKALAKAAALQNSGGTGAGTGA